jgi:hypothetical protein
MDAGVERVLKIGLGMVCDLHERKRKWEVTMALDWQVLLVALVAISLQLAVLATSLQPDEQPSQLNQAGPRQEIQLRIDERDRF